MSPVVLGDPPSVTSHAGFYNRNCTVLAALAILESTCRRNPEPTQSRFFGGVSSGCAVALAAFLKVSYCLGIGFLVLALIPCMPQSRRRWAGLVAGAVATLLPFWFLMGGTFLPMIEVLLLLAGAKHIVLGWALVDAGIYYLLPMALFTVMVAVLLWQDGARADARDILIALVAVSAAGLFFQSANDPRVVMPLNPILAIVAMQRLAQAGRTEGARSLSHSGAALMLVLLMVVVTGSAVARDGAGLLYALHHKSQNERTPGMAFHAAVLSGAASSEKEYVEVVNDGIELLKGHLRPGDTVGTLDFANPFTYALGLQPQEGGSSSKLAYRFDYIDRSKPSPEFMMEPSITWMMITQNFAADEPMARNYGPYLESHFHLEAQSAEWRLYRRNE
jgi:hypothetical protein